MKDTRTENNEEHGNTRQLGLQLTVRLTTMLRKVDQIMLKILRRRMTFHVKKTHQSDQNLPTEKTGSKEMSETILRINSEKTLSLSGFSTDGTGKATRIQRQHRDIFNV